jgi:serine/threonine protein kinase
MEDYRRKRDHDEKLEEIWELCGRELGSGAFGTVFLHTENPTLVIKRTDIKKHGFTKAYREAYVMHRLDHQNIIKIRRAICFKEDFFIFMDRADGSLDQQKGFLLKNSIKALQVVEQICQGLASMHQQGFVHLDIKLNNILYCKDEDDVKVFISDFGLSRLEDMESTVLYQAMIPPEMAGLPSDESEPDNKAMDIWMLAHTIYDLFAEENEWRTLTSREIYITQIEKRWRPNIDDVDVQVLLNSMWRKNPVDRPEITTVLADVSELIQKKMKEESDERGICIIT